MNKNTYLGLALTACLSIVSTSLLAEVDPADDINAPIPKFKEPLEPSEQQLQQMEHKKSDITAPEPPADDINAPIPKFKEPLEPSEQQLQQMERNKAIAK
ncbi:MAG: hypothetical protein PHD43_17060 [Methylococcales bacterium]|nr:hypothetical protein [Methylococcales bacterium]